MIEAERKRKELESPPKSRFNYIKKQTSSPYRRNYGSGQVNGLKNRNPGLGKRDPSNELNYFNRAANDGKASVVT